MYNKFFAGAVTILMLLFSYIYSAEDTGSGETGASIHTGQISGRITDDNGQEALNN